MLWWMNLALFYLLCILFQTCWVEVKEWNLEEIEVLQKGHLISNFGILFILKFLFNLFFKVLSLMLGLWCVMFLFHWFHHCFLFHFTFLVLSFRRFRWRNNFHDHFAYSSVNLLLCLVSSHISPTCFYFYITFKIILNFHFWDELPGASVANQVIIWPHRTCMTWHIRHRSVGCKNLHLGAC